MGTFQLALVALFWRTNQRWTTLFYGPILRVQMHAAGNSMTAFDDTVDYSFDYSGAPYPIRQDIPDAYQAFWQRLAAPGSWWTGAQRVAIAAESRAALACPWCATRKAALSPYGQVGEHQQQTQSPGPLPTHAVDAVHRIVTDQSRITQRYVDDNAKNGLTKGAYVELVGIVVAVFSIDEFHRALGLSLEDLPTPEAGDVTQYQPAHLSEDIGFVPTVPLEGAVGPEADLWPNGRTANVIRALTLVPNALRDWREIGSVQYLSFQQMGNMGQVDDRALHRMQIEMIAGRVSAINECFY
jgi:hypothetical protein